MRVSAESLRLYPVLTDVFIPIKTQRGNGGKKEAQRDTHVNCTCLLLCESRYLMLNVLMYQKLGKVTTASSQKA